MQEKDKGVEVYHTPDEVFRPVHEAIHQVTAPGHHRNYRAWIFQGYILISVLGFAALALLVTLFQVNRFDVELTRELQSELPAWVGVLLQAVSWPGYAVQSITITALTALLIYLLGFRWESLLALAAALCPWLINHLIKVAIRRPRPSADIVEVFHELSSYSFPSGHVMYYTVFFGFLAFISFILFKRIWFRAALVAFFTALVILVGPSRIYLGEHWTSDVIAAYLLGFLILSGIIYVYRRGKRRYAPEQPVAPGGDEPFIESPPKVDNT